MEDQKIDSLIPQIDLKEESSDNQFTLVDDCEINGGVVDKFISNELIIFKKSSIDSYNVTKPLFKQF